MCQLSLSTWHKLALSGKRKIQLGNWIYQIGLENYQWGILFNDWCRRTHPLCGVTIGQVVLCCIWKVVEQTRESKPVSSIPPWSLLQFLLQVSIVSSYPDFLQWWSVTWELEDEINPFLLSLVLISFITAIATKLEQYITKNLLF